ncbi:MAG TPA: TauD/TfdA family dioxygenase [Alphaproteobacteria bacterium]|nr:TauD/TfdA family dioxygenase [Alphaproteobacteria bacterium]
MVRSLNPAIATARSAARLRPLDGGLGAEFVGFQVTAIDDASFPAVYGAFLKHQLLLFRDQDLPPAEQVAFARRFGEVQVHVMNQYHATAYPELYTLSNLDPEGRPSGKHPDRGTLAWHTDGSWRRVTGQATMLYAEQIPSDGGGTSFADMYSAYDALTSAEQAGLCRLRAIHNLNFSRSRRHGEEPMTEAQRMAAPPVDHPVVRTHPETGRKCVFLGDHAETIEGMAEAQGRAFVEALNERIVALARIYRHRWRQRDLMVWDNRCLMHKAEGYDTAREPRVIRRCTVLGEIPR